MAEKPQTEPCFDLPIGLKMESGSASDLGWDPVLGLGAHMEIPSHICEHAQGSQTLDTLPAVGQEGSR